MFFFIICLLAHFGYSPIAIGLWCMWPGMHFLIFATHLFDLQRNLRILGFFSCSFYRIHITRYWKSRILVRYIQIFCFSRTVWLFITTVAGDIVVIALFVAAFQIASKISQTTQNCPFFPIPRIYLNKTRKKKLTKPGIIPKIRVDHQEKSKYCRIKE